MEFQIEHHAALFAYLAREALQRCGAAGEGAVREGVRRYGRQRGRRMARRAQRDGEPLNMTSYLLYGEWADREGKNRQELLGLAPYATACLTCGWCACWQELGLLEYGKLYCLDVDKSLVEGFNPDLVLDIHSTLSAGAERCHFVWNGASFDGESAAAFAAKKAAMGEKNQRDFLYHTANLLHALGETFAPLLPGASCLLYTSSPAPCSGPRTTTAAWGPPGAARPASPLTAPASGRGPTFST